MGKKSAMGYLDELGQQGILLGLERIAKFLELLGNPQGSFKRCATRGAWDLAVTYSMAATDSQGMYTRGRGPSHARTGNHRPSIDIGEEVAMRVAERWRLLR